MSQEEADEDDQGVNPIYLFTCCVVWANGHAILKIANTVKKMVDPTRRPTQYHQQRQKGKREWIAEIRFLKAMDSVQGQ